VSSYDVLEVTACLVNVRTPFTKLANNRIDNVLVRIASELNQPLFQFINAVDVYMVNKATAIDYFCRRLIVDYFVD